MYNIISDDSNKFEVSVDNTCSAGFALLVVFKLHPMTLFADAVIPITCFILVCLFALQHYGTHRLGSFFAPVVMMWLLCISALGLFNIIYWNPQVYKALSPYYMFKFLKKTKISGWMSLGGILLCITGELGKRKDTMLNSHVLVCCLYCMGPFTHLKN